ncbi:hypothetical protein DFH06DRAFT_66139 [Mycena polygramma]|nr:hypothetical protein DFH06DRAFT_66139 [Mycena polygramma]
MHLNYCTDHGGSSRHSSRWHQHRWRRQVLVKAIRPSSFYFWGRKTLQSASVSIRGDVVFRRADTRAHSDSWRMAVIITGLLSRGEELGAWTLGQIHAWTGNGFRTDCGLQAICVVPVGLASGRGRNFSLPPFPTFTSLRPTHSPSSSPLLVPPSHSRSLLLPSLPSPPPRPPPPFFRSPFPPFLFHPLHSIFDIPSCLPFSPSPRFLLLQAYIERGWVAGFVRAADVAGGRMCGTQRELRGRRRRCGMRRGASVV